MGMFAGERHGLVAESVVETNADGRQIRKTTMRPTKAGEFADITVQSLDYWTVQKLLSTEDPEEQIRTALEAAVVDVAGEDPERWLKRPNQAVVNPVFGAIMDIAAGNWPPPAETECFTGDAQSE